MKIYRIASWMLLILLCSGIAQAQSLEDLIQKNIEARGGAKNIKAIQSLVQKGVSTQMGMESPLVLYMKRPNKLRREVSMQGIEMVMAYDGKIAWLSSPMLGPDPQKIPEDEAASLKNQSDIEGILFDYKKKGYVLSYEGEKKVGSADTYIIKAMLADSLETFIYLDKETYLEKRIDVTANVPAMGGEITVENYLSDYREIKGLLLPFKYETYVKGQLFQTLKMEDVTVNEELSDSLFVFKSK